LETTLPKFTFCCFSSRTIDDRLAPLPGLLDKAHARGGLCGDEALKQPK
jgi:hypothetical protein